MSESTQSPRRDHPVSRVDTRVILRKRAIRAEIAPRMSALHAHFSAIVERISPAPVPLSMDYSIEGFANLRVTRLEGFLVRCDDIAQPSEVSLQYEARGHVPLKILPSTGEEYFTLRHALFDHRLEFTSGIAATVSKITLKPVIPIEMAFRADWDDGSVRLSMRNFQVLGVREYRLAPPRIDIELMGAIENGVLHQVGDVYGLLGAPPEA